MRMHLYKKVPNKDWEYLVEGWYGQSRGEKLQLQSGRKRLTLVNTRQIGEDNTRGAGGNEEWVATVKAEDDQDKSGSRNEKEVTSTTDNRKASKPRRPEPLEIGAQRKRLWGRHVWGRATVADGLPRRTDLQNLPTAQLLPASYLCIGSQIATCILSDNLTKFKIIDKTFLPGRPILIHY